MTLEERLTLAFLQVCGGMTLIVTDGVEGG